jgi:hypothetical protein
VAGGVGRDAAGKRLAVHHEVTVGLVGPHALLERIVLAAGLPGESGGRDDGNPRTPADDSDDGSLPYRLLPAAYADELQAPDKVGRLGTADAWLFASQVPLEYARRAGVLRCPATYIHLADGPLMAALVRAIQAGYDPARASFDTFSRLEAMHALADLGVPARRLHVREEIATPAAMASYHSRLWHLGQTSAAITCLDEVARRLEASQVPAIAVQPSDHAIASALQTAILLAERHALTAAQLAVALVEVPELRDRRGRRVPRQAREELRLAVHGFLVHEAQQMDATVSLVSEHGFLVIATGGSLAAATGGGGELQFKAAAARTLGVTLDIGIGTGRTEREAEEAARKRLAPRPSAGATRRLSLQAGKLEAAAPVPLGPATAEPASPPVQLTRATGTRSTGATWTAAASGGPGPGSSGPGEPEPGGTDHGEPQQNGPSHSAPGPERAGQGGLVPTACAQRAVSRPVAARAGTPPDSLSRLRSLETLTRLAQKLAADAAPVVDAELTGELLSVTPRTARRQLRAMADQGLALPLPPRRNRHPGRPRQAYRLVVEELGREAARSRLFTQSSAP